MICDPQLGKGLALTSSCRPDVGTARVDFPGGSADDLYTSIQKIMELDGETKVFSGEQLNKNKRALVGW